MVGCAISSQLSRFFLSSNANGPTYILECLHGGLLLCTRILSSMRFNRAWLYQQTQKQPGRKFWATILQLQDAIATRCQHVLDLSGMCLDSKVK